MALFHRENYVKMKSLMVDVGFRVQQSHLAAMKSGPYVNIDHAWRSFRIPVIPAAWCNLMYERHLVHIIRRFFAPPSVIDYDLEVFNFR